MDAADPQPSTETHPDRVLDIRHLSVTFGSESRVHAVVDVDLHVDAGERVGVIGESGSGKSVTAMSVLRLLDGKNSHLSQDSAIQVNGQDVLAMGSGELRRVRGSQLGMVFQDPMNSLNPTRRIGPQITGVLKRLEGMSASKARTRTLELLEEVELPDPARTYRSYPHQLSGGMRQRVLIAMVLAREPGVLVADEPTSALDVTVQAALLEMLRKRTQERGISVLLITHDLGVVAQFCERVYVMYGGRVVEEGPVSAILQHPAHPYTAALAGCVPRIRGPLHDELPTIEGRQMTRRQAPTTCTFVDRCDFAVDLCSDGLPSMRKVPESGTTAACVRAEELVGFGDSAGDRQVTEGPTTR